VSRLLEENGGTACEIVIIRTSGDESPGPPDAPTDGGSVPGIVNVKRMFVKEIEDALLGGSIDVAVHSSKDLPALLPEGLVIGAALEREDPRDALLLPATVVEGVEGSGGLEGPKRLDAVKRTLGRAPRIGTSSIRRTAELRRLFPAATFTPVRGNVDTRLRKLDAGECDVLVLAAAGLKRMNLESRVSAYLPIDVCVPAPGQGIVAVETRTDAPAPVKTAVTGISDADADAALTAERAVVQALGGGCQMPLGVFATVDGQDVTVIGRVTSSDGRHMIRAAARGNRGNPAAVGEKLARLLLDKGAAQILERARTATDV
jgi:hydroxymethylbilane synthase